MFANAACCCVVVSSGGSEDETVASPPQPANASATTSGANLLKFISITLSRLAPKNAVHRQRLS
ncbi:hypothetical protein [Burkholderia stagnalis]|uniref:hypothetical protein n=1 Tax=Burkholderia stagnalis TaxID=1503054 RepID=UPI0021AB88B2|nr:hypothetical protein [Burkholderia stagnalis]